MFCSAIILSAGKGNRLKSNVSKQFLNLKNKAIIIHTLERFLECKSINQIILVLAKNQIDYFYNRFKNILNFEKINIVEGGEERSISVKNAIKFLDIRCDIVLVHDGVRPFVCNQIIENVITNTSKYGACIPIVKPKDTIKVVENLFVKSTLNREVLYCAQTPQGFDTKILKEVYEKNDEILNFTDDASLVEYYGYKVFTIDGDYKNIKITTNDDLIFAKAILGQ